MIIMPPPRLRPLPDAVNLRSHGHLQVMLEDDPGDFDIRYTDAWGDVSDRTIWWKFSSGVLRACGFGPDQAARSRLIGAMG